MFYKFFQKELVTIAVSMTKVITNIPIKIFYYQPLHVSIYLKLYPIASPN